MTKKDYAALMCNVTAFNSIFEFPAGSNRVKIQQDVCKLARTNSSVIKQFIDTFVVEVCILYSIH